MTAVPTIKITSAGDLVASLPYQLGYQPSECVVIVALRGPELVMLARCPIPLEIVETNTLANQTVETFTREHVDTIILVAYDETGEAKELTSALGEQAILSGIKVKECIRVQNGYWRSLLCDDQDCCGPYGTPISQPEDVAAVAELVMATGTSPVGDMTALAALYLQDPALAAETAAATDGLDPDRDLALQVWARYLNPKASVDDLTPAEYGEMLVSLRDIQLRDALIGWLCPGTLPMDSLDAEIREALAIMPETWDSPGPDSNILAGRITALAQRSPREHAPAILTMLASFEWWKGDGARTRLALERALDVDPNYRLARLIDHMVALGIRPRGNS